MRHRRKHRRKVQVFFKYFFDDQSTSQWVFVEEVEKFVQDQLLKYHFTVTTVDGVTYDEFVGRMASCPRQ